MKPFDSYFGGKGSDGTFQTIINRIRPHQHYFELFAGNATIARHKKVANGFNVLVDIDPKVYQRLVETMPNFSVKNINSIEFLKHELLDFFDKNDGCCIYADPPYPIKSRKSNHRYNFELSDNDHIDLLELLKRCKCDVIISTYPNQIYKESLSEWHRIEFQNTTRNGVATEWLFTNYSTITELHDYRFLGNNHRERQLLKKKTNRWITNFKNLPVLQQAQILDFLQNE